MAGNRSQGEAVGREGDMTLPLAEGGEADQPQAWEMVENGRYMPRRIRGSFRGRELG